MCRSVSISQNAIAGANGAVKLACVGGNESINGSDVVDGVGAFVRRQFFKITLEQFEELTGITGSWLVVIKEIRRDLIVSPWEQFPDELSVASDPLGGDEHLADLRIDLITP